MQVSATLIAAQQAAREAQARFQTQNVTREAPAAGPSFASALGAKDGFAPLSFQQTALTAAPRPQAAPGAPFLGTQLDITI